MKVYKSLDILPQFESSVITIGSFDGVHSAHKKILTLLTAKAREYNTQSVVITFSPHPRMVLSQNDSDFRLLSTEEEKIELLEKAGVDVLVIVPFTFEFSQMDQREYVGKFICEKFHPVVIILGYDHRFGKNRSGNIELIKQYEEKCGFKLLIVEKQEYEDIAISSSKIREFLLQGDVDTANILLGRNYSFKGKVIHGNKLGRQIGFRTANLLLDKNKLVPADGVYAVKVEIDGKMYDGMLYIGKKYYGDDKQSRTIEVNIFDFNEDIYGKEITVYLIAYVRKGIRFTSKQQVIEQLNKDKETIIKILKEYKAPTEPKKNIAIVLLNYNGINFLEEFLDIVLHKTELDVRYIIADNASTDESVSFVEKYYPEVEIYRLDDNYGFSIGYNRVIRSLDNVEYVVFLNSDVEVEEGWLEPVIDLMKRDKTIAIAQPKILSFNDKEYFEYAGAAGGYLDALAYPFCRGRVFDVVEKDKGQYDDTVEVFWASGAAMVMRKEVFDKFGGFDPDFFAHQEEIDLAWRVKRAGYKVMAVGNSKVFHVGGGTLSYINPMKTYLNFRNNMMMILKNESAGHILWKFPLRLVLDGIAGVKFIFEGKFKSVYAILKAHGYIYSHFSKIMKKRKHYNKLIRDYSVGPYRKAGLYNGSIIVDYYLLGKKHFNEIVKK